MLLPHTSFVTYFTTKNHKDSDVAHKDGKIPSLLFCHKKHSIHCAQNFLWCELWHKFVLT